MRVPRIAAKALMVLASLAGACGVGAGAVSTVQLVGASSARATQTEQVLFADVIDSANGTPVRFDSVQLGRFGSELRNELEATGTLDGYSADPSSFSNIEGQLGIDPFVETNACSDCGRLTGEFKDFIEANSADTLRAEAEAVAAASTGSILVSNAIAAVLAYLAASTAALWVVLRNDAKRNGYDWRSVRWEGVYPIETKVRLAAPGYFLTVNRFAGQSDKRYRQALESLGLADAHDQAQAAIRKLRGMSNPSSEMTDDADELGRILEDIDIVVAQHKPELSRVDGSGSVMHVEAKETIAELSERLDALSQARAEVGFETVPRRRTRP